MAKANQFFFYYPQGKRATTREPRNFWTFYPRPKSCLQIAAMMLTGSALPYVKKAFHPAYLPEKLERYQSNMTKSSINSATKSKTCLAESKTGVALRCATIAALTHFSRPYASQQLLSSISINES